MKNFLKKSLVIFAMLFSFFSVANLTLSNSAYATTTNAPDESIIENNPCRDGILGLKPWDCHTYKEPSSEQELQDNIYIIISNIANNITVIAAYLVVGYVIYGGYLYILAAGDTVKVAAGKKTLAHAFTGLAIVGLSNVIINSIQLAIFNNNGTFNECKDVLNANSTCITPEVLVTNVIQWVIGIGGVVALAFIILGGIKYITSSGDINKTQQAKNTILYSLIGLVVVGLSEIIVAFVSDIINGANTDGNIGDSAIIILNNVIAVSSVIAVIFIIIGGVGYITSAGDTTKVQKAKSTIKYACIGLAVCALAAAIVNFAIGAINNPS